MPPRARRAAVAAALLALTAWRPAPVAALDRAVRDAVTGFGPEFVSRWLTRYGDTAVVVLLAVVFGLLRRRRGRGVVVLVVGVVAASLLADVGKELFDRPRPPDAALTNPGFPSGHAARTGALAALVRRRFVVVLAVVVALTRLFLGVHWLSDVVGGAALGVLVAEACPPPKVPRRRRRRAGS